MMEVNDKILERIEEWRQQDHSLPELLKFYKDLLSAQSEFRACTWSGKPHLSEDEVNARINQGIPLLEWDALSLDWPTFQNLFQIVIAPIGKRMNSSSKGLREVSSDMSLLKEMTKAWYENSSLLPWARANDLEEEPLAAAIHCTVKPFLVAQAEALIALVPQQLWRLNYCPVCGGKPDFAFLEKEKGARWLLCSRCDAQWLFQRTECPFCGNKDEGKLKYFVDEEGLYRLYVCDQCKAYLKAIDLRRTEAEILLPFERVLTADMDRQGQEKGYKAG
ncbi:MAG: formate dehydrogenase accessory protein FdhE [Dehalococcoidia bacterium]